MAAAGLDEQALAALFGLIPGQPLPHGREQNSGICWKYIIEWAGRELLRETVQNLIDAVHSYVKKIAHDLNPEHVRVRCTKPSTDFEWTIVPGVGQPPLVLGSIKYDAASKQLTLKNFGTIPMEGLLMGGGVKAGAQLDPNIAGRFGEGLKLAILCALRSGKSITIRTGGSLWTFGLRWDTFFGQHCVFFLVDKDEDHDPNQTTVVIGGISEAEWVSNPQENQGVHAFLSLRDQLGENIGAIPSHTPGLGVLLTGPHVRGCIFVKGIFVTRPMHDIHPYEFGYNFTEMKLDRDRNTTTDQNQLNEATSSLIVDVLHNWQALAVLYPAATQYDTMVDMVYRGLVYNSWESLSIHAKWPLTAGKHPVCSSLIDRWRERNEVPDDFMPTADSGPVMKQRIEYGLSADFYEVHGVSWSQFHNFNKGANYESLVERMQRYTQQQLYDQGLEHPAFNEAFALWQRIDPAFPRARVRFTGLQYNQCYMLQNVIYLSADLLDDAKVQERDGPGTNAVKKIIEKLASFQGVAVSRLFGLFQI